MNYNTSKSRGFELTIAMVALVFIGVHHINGQTTEQPTSDLIKRLTYQSTDSLALGLFRCGRAFAADQENRIIADALVDRGTLALPDIERALSTIKKDGESSQFAYNSEWLLEVYARIRGRAAFPRLRAMTRIPRLGFLKSGISNAIAISLGLTSYVYASQPLGVPKMCSLVLEPADILNQLVLAWQKDNRQYLEASLAPRAKIALQSFMGNGTWESLRAQLWQGMPSDDVAVGFRFETSGWWSAREQPLQIHLDTRIPSNPKINTVFTTKGGVECASEQVEFAQSGDIHISYLVNNSDITRLLRAIASCAAESDKAG